MMGRDYEKLRVLERNKRRLRGEGTSIESDVKSHVYGGLPWSIGAVVSQRHREGLPS